MKWDVMEILMFTCAWREQEQWNLCKYSYTIFIKFPCGFFVPLHGASEGRKMGIWTKSLSFVELDEKGFLCEEKEFPFSDKGKRIFSFNFGYLTDELRGNCCCEGCSCVVVFMIFFSGNKLNWDVILKLFHQSFSWTKQHFTSKFIPNFLSFHGKGSWPSSK